MKDIYKVIVEFMTHQKFSGGKESFRTREIADAVGLTIYQTRLYLEALQSLGVVEKINSGKGVPGLWELR
ncbi:TPA: FaeA/PapI family transcriptional regulator [Escherichia coli]|uniref:FaeA/PapI family transcriptional regulator n=1 Tax=Escherichia coli TaxID=562 RepID=UPI003CC7EF91